MSLQNAYQTLFAGSLYVLAFLTLCGLIRAIRGPRIADRVVAINMISTLVIAMICILAVVKGEGYLVDIALIYSLLGFLAVVVLCKVFMGIANQRKAMENEQKKPAESTACGDEQIATLHNKPAAQPKATAAAAEKTAVQEPAETAAGISYFHSAKASNWQQDKNKLDELLAAMQNSEKEEN